MQIRVQSVNDTKRIVFQLPVQSVDNVEKKRGGVKGTDGNIIQDSQV